MTRRCGYGTARPARRASCSGATRAAVGSVTFSPDGNELASVGADGVVRVWALDRDDLVEIAERKVTRSLTDAECRQYLHVDACGSG